MYVLAIVVILLLLYLTLTKRKNKNCEDFPEPPGLFFFGHAFAARTTTDVIPVASQFIKKYGKTVKVRLSPFFRVILTTDYKLVEFFLSSNSILTKSLNYKYASSWLGDSLLIGDGVRWHKHRKILTPAFHLEILRQFVNTFETVGDVFIEKLYNLKEPESVDLDPLVTLATLDVICETAMETKINAQNGENLEYVNSVQEMCRIIISRSMSPLKLFKWTYWMTNDFYIEKKILKILHNFTKSVVAKRKERQSVANKNKKPAFLDLLLKFSSSSSPLSDQEIREEVDTFMFAGHDTTASGICFALYCLANHPEFQEKVLQEQQDLFGSEKNPSVTYQDLQNMKYLEYVIKETLRLYPSVPMVGRLVTEDTKFEHHTIPKNTNISIFIYGIHRNLEYFSEPEKFNPERFENLNVPPYAYIPFSAGPRNCIGQKFAMLEMKSIISKVIRHFELKPANPHHELILAVETVLKSTSGTKIGLKKRV